MSARAFGRRRMRRWQRRVWLEAGLLYLAGLAGEADEVRRRKAAIDRLLGIGRRYGLAFSGWW